MIDPAKLIAFDVETKGKGETFGLQPWRARDNSAWLTTCAVAYMKNGGVISEGLVRPTFAQLDRWLDSVLAGGQWVVCWNAPFDVAWLIALGHREKVMKVKWLDGLLMLRHLVNAPKFRPEGQMSMGLKPAVARRWPDMADYADDIDFDDESPENTAKLLEYNQRDSRFTLQLAIEYLEEMSPGVMRAMVLEAASIASVADATVSGIHMDRDIAAKLGETLEDARTTAFVTLRLQHGADITDKVLASPTQLRELLFTKWGLPVVELTDTGNPSTDKATLHELALSDPRAGLIHAYRDAAYCKAKFSVSPVASMDYNEEVDVSHPAPRIFGTYTGRMTYSSKTGRGREEKPTGVALHQWKRDKLYRQMITVPDGYDLLEFDFAGQEFRWMAVESGDEIMMELCMPGEDAHGFMGAKCTGISYEAMKRGLEVNNGEFKPKRQLGKVANLSLQFRTSPPTLVRVAAVQHGVKLTLPEARAIHATYLTTYRKVPRYWRRQIDFARRHGYVETLAGRQVQLGTTDTWKYADGNDAKWSHESTAINFPIQGVGADQKYLAMAVLKDMLPRYDARFYFELHDGLFVVAPKDKSERAGHDIKHTLSNLPYKRAWGVDLPVAFPVDGKRGPSWGDLKEFN